MRTRVILAIAALIPLAALSIYALNPLGVPSQDPRGRLLGVIPYRESSDSMLPTIARGEIVVACTGSYAWSQPARGDIVAFWTPPELESAYVKRIVAIAGDTVEFRAGRYLLNGIVQDEPYVEGVDDLPDMPAAQVPADSVFVAGDNRAHSYDSRFFGPVQVSTIIGKMCAKL
ncbi:MAG: signal peptidase I [Gammaproteobacteria bacterium RIFCSPHIGHO2_12_FULL_63_22]|nr:MAG: signal peptidase I [Gammaproteobacteria bacterium RIFCSPHIGHO2_12_FULL_63_22]